MNQKEFEEKYPALRRKMIEKDYKIKLKPMSKEYIGNERKEDEGRLREKKEGSLKRTERINSREKTDVDDKLNVVSIKKGRAKEKALSRMKK